MAQGIETYGDLTLRSRNGIVNLFNVQGGMGITLANAGMYFQNSGFLMTNTAITFNNNNNDVDFIVKSDSGGNAVAYDAGTDSFSVNIDGSISIQTGSATASFLGENGVTIQAGSGTVSINGENGVTLSAPSGVMGISGENGLTLANYNNDMSLASEVNINIDSNSGSIYFNTGGGTSFDFNSDANDNDFFIRKLNTGTAYSYDAGTDVHAFTGNLVIPVKTDTGDPTGVADGHMYLNSADNVLKIYEGGAWRTIASW